MSSFSGSSAARSRLSIMPDTVIEAHGTLAPLPDVRRSTKVRRSIIIVALSKQIMSPEVRIADFSK